MTTLSVVIPVADIRLDESGLTRINVGSAAELHMLLRLQSWRLSDTHYPDRP
jgi:hypothetical protein